MTTATLTPTTRLGHHQSGAAREIAEPECSVSADDVCDLIAAAGPLTVADIAGGLDVPVRRAAARVRQMLGRTLLKEDEFARYRAWGACADR